MLERTETNLASSVLDELDRSNRAILEKALGGRAIDAAEAESLIEIPRRHLPALLFAAAAVRTARKGHTVTYSPKVFLPVTNLCLDRCSYCTFRKDPTSPMPGRCSPRKCATSRAAAAAWAASRRSCASATSRSAPIARIAAR